MHNPDYDYLIINDEAARTRAVGFINGLDLRRPWIIENKIYRPDRSDAQNRLYWKWLSFIAPEFGYSPEDLHEVIKARFLGFKDFTFQGNVYQIPRSTRTLKVAEFTELMQKLEALAMTQNISLPHPADYLYAHGGKKPLWMN